MERLLLMFKGFECLNGAHSGLHRDAFEPVLDHLDQKEISRLADTHNLIPRWPEPWKKARTAGSDDHGLLNVGRTWTEFPPATRTIEEVLHCLRTGACRPAGEAGTSPKLAHTFYSVAVRYFTHHMLAPGRSPSYMTAVLQTIVGERPAPTRAELLRYAVKRRLKSIGKRIIQPFRPEPEPIAGTAVLTNLILKSARKHFGEYPALLDILKRGLPPLGEHEDMFALVNQINRDVTAGVAAALKRSLTDVSFTGLFDTLGAAMAQQFVLLPYYFTCFHQNKERHLLREITRQHSPRNAGNLRVGLFTDTLDEINGVGRFIRDMGEQATRSGRNLTIHTCTDNPVESGGENGPGLSRKNFLPLFSRPMPYYGELKLNLPPLLEIMEWADRQQFDAIHVSTPGPMGLCGWVVSKMLRVPLLGTYHTDFPAYVENLTGDHRVTNGTITYMEWFYGQMATVFSRSREYLFNLHDLGIPDDRLRTIQPGVNTEKFSPLHATDDNGELWKSMGIDRPHRLLYVGRVSVEKNLPLLAEAFERLCKHRSDVALVIAGNGPYLEEMRNRLASLPAHFLGYQNDRQLGRLYASSDLFVFPSRTDTLGQVVMEAQASGLPVLVSNEGGPKEMMSDGLSGLSLPATDPTVWSRAIDSLLNDHPRRQWMARYAPERMARHSLARTFDSFWNEHLLAVEPGAKEAPTVTAAEAPVSSPA
jgi:glycosyltransferase involved in cell wall biosynthesis